MHWGQRRRAGPISRPGPGFSAPGTLRAMRVRVDAEACTGHGRCYSLAPELFSADDEGHCVLEHEEVPEGLEDQARLGVQNCPERAITVED
jgi:ferredoxin